MSYPWRDEEIVRHLYHEKRMPTREVADELGCSQNTVIRWMDRLGIESRDRTSEAARTVRRKPARFHTDIHGYERWVTRVGDGAHKVVRVHRLLAVAKYGVDAVDGKVVHHRNNVPWDNRPENIELMDHGEHASMHLQGNKNAATGVGEP